MNLSYLPGLGIWDTTPLAEVHNTIGLSQILILEYGGTVVRVRKLRPKRGSYQTGHM